jgi:glycosyltransferase involved in cell wall biosynthesis
MSSQPLVSVCIPSYNGAAFIGQTIQSVLNQTFKKFELIVADDRSSDETVSIVTAFSDERIRFIRNESNLGLTGNWNQMLSMNLGKYVKLLCDDDILHPECLARQVAILDDHSHEGVVLTACNRNVINQQDRVVLAGRRSFGAGVISGPSLIRKCVRRGLNLIGEPAVALFRRTAIAKHEMCAPGNPYMSDLNLWAEILKHGYAYLDPQCLASFRISRVAATAKIGPRQAAYFREFALRLRGDSFYRVGLMDMMLGCVLSFHWSVLRNVFIHLHTSPDVQRTCGCAGVRTRGTPLVTTSSHEKCA